MWSDKPSDKWTEVQNKLDSHFLQTMEWAQFQNALGHKTYFACGQGWSWMAVLESGRFGSRLYCPYGPTVKSKAALEHALNALIKCAQSQGLMYVRIEPQGPLNESQLKNIGLKPAHRNIQPHYTFVKDLTKSTDEMMAEMSATNRNLYRTASKKGITFRHSSEPKDVEIFLKMMHEVADKNELKLHSDNYYRIMAEVLMPLNALKLYIADIEGKPAASSIVLDSRTTRCYAHAASYTESRKLHPGTPLVATMFFDAKEVGQKKFDFFGIAAPDQPNSRWSGFTSFKQSFGGQEVNMHGTWEKGINNLTYALYRSLTKLEKLHHSI